MFFKSNLYQNEVLLLIHVFFPIFPKCQMRVNILTNFQDTIDDDTRPKIMFL